MVGAARIQRMAVALMASAPAIATTLGPERRPEEARIWRTEDFLATTGTPTSALPIVEAAAKDIALGYSRRARWTSAGLERRWTRGGRLCVRLRRGGGSCAVKREPATAKHRSAANRVSDDKNDKLTSYDLEGLADVDVCDGSL